MEIQKADKNISKEIINSFFEFLDTNFDGSITYHEYKTVTDNSLSHNYQINTTVCFINFLNFFL